MPSERQLLRIQPSDVKLPFELKKHISCSLRLVNSTDNYIAFKVKTTSPKKYSVRPNTGLVLPQSSSDVVVTMQAQWEAPPTMQCKDKFLVQSVIAPFESTAKDVSQELFNKDAGNEVHEAKLKVLFIAPPGPQSPVAGSEAKEGLSPKMASAADNGGQFHGSHDMLSKDARKSKAKPIEPSAEHVTMTAESNSSVEVIERLVQHESPSRVAQMDKGNTNKATSQALKQSKGFSLLFLLIIGVLGIFVGYFISPYSLRQ